MAKGGKKGGGSGGGEEQPLILIGTSADDRLSGGSLNDRLIGHSGNDQLRGNGGTDTAVFSGDIQGYSITYGKRGTIIVTDIDLSDGDDGTDTLSSIEYLEFANYTYSTTSENLTPLVTYTDTMTVSENDVASYTFSVQAMNGGDPRGYVTNAGVSTSLTDATLSSDGSTRTLTYEIGSGWGPAIESLAEGETTEQSFEIVAGTLYGGYNWRQTVTVTIVGVNDAPTLADGLLVVEEDGGARSLDLSALGDDIDSDDDGTTLTYRIVDAPAGFQYWTSGTELFFDPGAAFQELERTDSAYLTLTIEAVDAHGVVSNAADITIEIQGQNDPLPNYLQPNGAVDYAALGLTVPASVIDIFDGLSPTQELLDFVAATPGDDQRIVTATHVVSLDDNTFFGAPDTTVALGDGNDTVAFVLEGQNATFGGFSGVGINTGNGNDVVVLDATRVTDSFYINVTDIRTGDGSDQVLVDLSTEADGWADDFRYGLEINTGRDNDFVSIRRVDSDGGETTVLKGSISMEAGDDELSVLQSVQNVDDGRFVATISMGHGNDIARIDTSGTTGASVDAKTGLYGSVLMGDGDDVLHLNLADPTETDAFATIHAGDHPYYPEDFDVLYLEMGTISEFTVTQDVDDYGTSRYQVEWNGQTLGLYGWEEVYASDGLLI